MKKFFMSFALILISALSIFCFAGCGGESAYEIAVRNGYKGTESQWLESLKGNNGQDGEAGVSYEDIRKLYDDLVARGEYSGTFLSFVKEYISVYDAGSEVVANQCLLSTVSVTTYFAVDSIQKVGAGSGVIYKIDEGNSAVYIVTNYHVVYVYQNNGIAEQIFVNLYGSEGPENEIACSYLGGSESLDIAVLKVTGAEAKKIINSGAEEVELGEFNDITVGESVLAIGNPKAEGITVVDGIVSADNRYIVYDISSVRYYHRVFQVDAQINGGNSGGGLFNSDGFLIGIVSAKYASSYDYYEGLDVVEGMSYVIPLTNVVSATEYIISNCDGKTVTKVKAFNFGITISGANSKAEYDTNLHKTVITEDVGIQTVTTNSLAEKVGLVEGDILKQITVTKEKQTISFNITRDFMVGDILMFLEVGDSVTFTVLRDQSQITLNAYKLTAEDEKYLKTI